MTLNLEEAKPFITNSFVAYLTFEDFKCRFTELEDSRLGFNFHHNSLKSIEYYFANEKLFFSLV